MDMVREEQFRKAQADAAYNRQLLQEHQWADEQLNAARDTYGYNSAGPLRLPCSVDEFLRLRALVDRETAHSSSHRVHVHAGGHQQHGYSFAPCTRARVTS
ncbi:hypothetical protein TRIUR3_35274 [Triticum urartu]|uniref:Uncharacterized protein n=1 Tax=Triticum urartu TaxID=4572 RepID=M7ZUZ2_TRIUA|nr:hypothetical protein TRIUR3_35274 [Triticum urartu]